MNEIIHKFLLAGSKIMPEMHLRWPWFSASGLFTKKKERIKKIKKERKKETGDSRYIYLTN